MRKLIPVIPIKTLLRYLVETLTAERYRGPGIGKSHDKFNYSQIVIPISQNATVLIMPHYHDGRNATRRRGIIAAVLSLKSIILNLNFQPDKTRIDTR